MAIFLAVSTGRIPARATDTGGLLSLPWATQASWWFNGPHTWGGNGLGPWNSLDFEGSDRGHDQVLAASDGTAHLDGKPQSCGYVRVDEGNGWQTTYIHLTQSLKNDGDSVHRGDVLGVTDINVSCFGAANANHVHFSIWYVPAGSSFCFGCTNYGVDWQGLNGGQGGWQEQIGDYIWTDGAQEYQGCASNLDTAAQTCWQNYLAQSIYNDGDIAGQHSGPGAASRGSSRLDVMWADGSGAIHHKWSDNGGSTWGYELVPGGFSISAGTSPATVAWDSSHFDIFARGTDGLLYRTSQTNGTWLGNWVQDSNVVIAKNSGPAVASRGSGALDVFWADGQGVLHHAWEFNANYSWGYESIPGGFTISANSSPTAVAWSASHFDVAARGTDGLLYRTSQTNSVWAGGWTQESSMSLRQATSPSLSTRGSGALDAFWADSNGGMHHCWEFNGNYAWGCEAIPGGFTISDASSPASVAWDSSHFDVFARGTDGLLYHTSQTNSVWQGSWDQDSSATLW